MLCVCVCLCIWNASAFELSSTNIVTTSALVRTYIIALNSQLFRGIFILFTVLFGRSFVPVFGARSRFWWCGDGATAFAAYNCFIISTFYRGWTTIKWWSKQATNQPTNQANALSRNRWILLEIFGKRKLRRENLPFYNHFFSSLDIDFHLKMWSRVYVCDARIQTDYYHIQHSSTHFK